MTYSSPITCRSCGAALEQTLVDLGMSPLSNNYLTLAQRDKPETFHPLTVRICTHCWLAQLPTLIAPQAIFEDYAYFSSYSDSWLAHCARYVEQVRAAFQLGPTSRVIELASNDGYLLQFFLRHGIPVLGIEPAANVAQAAQAKGIPTLVRFFGRETARELLAEGGQADLLIGNNVLAHVPDLNDFIAGMRMILKPDGVLTMEFPHLLRLLEGNQFDTIYHEHFSYFSFAAVERAFARHGLTIFDVEQLSTHGGSLRIYAQQATPPHHPVTQRVLDMRSLETDRRMEDLATYQQFAERVAATKHALLAFLIAAKKEGRRVAGYGAPAKGNTLLNYGGIRSDFLDYTTDRNPHKQGRFLPGVHLPIFPPEHIFETKPDYVLILPWNLADEIAGQMEGIRAWGGKFVVPIPQVKVLP